VRGNNTLNILGPRRRVRRVRGPCHLVSGINFHLVSIWQARTSLSTSDFPLPTPVASSFSVDLLFSSSHFFITASNLTCFTNPSQLRLFLAQDWVHGLTDRYFLQRHIGFSHLILLWPRKRVRRVRERCVRRWTAPRTCPSTTSVVVLRSSSWSWYCKRGHAYTTVMYLPIRS